MKKLLAQGAEAKIYLSGSKIIKDRIKKSYRLPEIDYKLRKYRTRAEARLLEKASRVGVNVPSVLEEKNNKLIIEFIDGEKLRDYIDSAKASDLKKFMILLGKEIRKLHKANLIHGDLTTSNLILKYNQIFFIDFGLSQYSTRIEDKAVDLHLFKECLRSKHYKHWKTCWKLFEKGYKNKKILEHIKKIESRGRYKT